METIEQVQDYLNNIPFINSGGCAIAALAMKRWYKKYKDIETTVVYTHTYGDIDFVRNNEALRNNDGSLMGGCSHALLYVGGDFIDSNEYPDMRWADNILFIEDEQFVVNSINIDNWNMMFNRNYVSEIAAALDIDLTDINIIV